MSLPRRRLRGPFLIGFLENNRIAHSTYVEDVIDYWNDLYDMMDLHDVMIVQARKGRPLTQQEMNSVWTLMVENMSDDGYPLIRGTFNGMLSVRMDKRAAPFGIRAYRQYKEVLGEGMLEDIFGESLIKKYESIIRKQKTCGKRSS